MTEDQYISLAHGNGGRLMRELIEQLIAKKLDGLLLDIKADAAHLDINLTTDQQLMISTDGFTVQPLEFPGGDIGSLAVHGTVNDMAVSGATPCYLTLNLFIEEGFEFNTLKRLLTSLANAAREANVKIAAGDTKVVRRGEAHGLYMATTGVGIKSSRHKLGMQYIKNGDAVLVSGPVGDHGVAVMLAREQFGLSGQLRSDVANVFPLTSALLALDGLRFMRDPTRGGLATVLHEISQTTGHGIHLEQNQLPIRDSVQSVCDMLGYDPLYLACEGRVVAIIDAAQAKQALTIWQHIESGKEACIIGQVTDQHQQLVLHTLLGGERILEELEDDPLPRIC